LPGGSVASSRPISGSSRNQCPAGTRSEPASFAHCGDTPEANQLGLAHLNDSSLRTRRNAFSFGRLADVIGRRSLFLFGVGGFTTASLLCGAAPNVWLLVTIEVVQSVASGAIFANCAAILIDAFPAARLSHAFGVYIAAASVAELFGPSAGGLIADSLGWRWIYWLNVPVGIACYVWGRKATALKFRELCAWMPGFLARVAG